MIQQAKFRWLGGLASFVLLLGFYFAQFVAEAIPTFGEGVQIATCRNSRSLRLRYVAVGPRSGAISSSDELQNAAVAIAADERTGFEVLLDDRDERPGVKFKDADLVGIPFRITIGSKKFAQDKVEILTRGTKQKQDVAIEAVVERVQQLARR